MLGADPPTDTGIFGTPHPIPFIITFQRDGLHTFDKGIPGHKFGGLAYVYLPSKMIYTDFKVAKKEFTIINF